MKIMEKWSEQNGEQEKLGYRCVVLSTRSGRIISILGVKGERAGGGLKNIEK